MKPRTVLGLASLAIAAICTVSSTAHAGLIVTSFGPTAFSSDTSAMNLALGITDFTIEDFEDTTLIPGLSYSLSGPASGTFTSLPNVAPISQNPTFTDNQWDGSHVLMNNSNNSLVSEGTRTESLTFHLVGDIIGFGVGLGNFQSEDSPLDQFPMTDHELLINGVSFGFLDYLFGWVGGRTTRNAYILISATNGDLIESVTFRNVLTGSAGDQDLLVFDHLGVRAAIPEPITLTLLGLGALGALGLRRRI